MMVSAKGRVLMKNKYKTARPDGAIMWGITCCCNFDCAYCVVERDHRMNDVIRDIDIEACVRTITNTKKTFNVYFTGGEPFLVPRFVELCKALSERHFISLASNLSQSVVKDFAREIDPKRVLMVVASFHGEELLRHNAYGTFVENFHKLKDQGMKIKVMEVAYPGLIPKVEYYRDLLRKEGIPLVFSPFIGTYAGKRYPADYTRSEVKYFGLPDKKFNDYYPKNAYCNAGYNVIAVLPNSEVAMCFDRSHEQLGSITTGISLYKDIIRCNKERCKCVIPRNFSYIYCQSFYKTRRYHLWLWVLIRQVVSRILSLTRRYFH
jgi:organic radical activating enzyme